MKEDKKENRMDNVIKQATKTIIKLGYHVPQVVVYGSRNNTMGIMSDFPAESDQKRELLMSLGAKMREANILGDLEEVFLISEAWMSVCKKGVSPNLAPSEDPARKEILMIFHQNILEGKTDGKMFDIIRGENKQIMELKVGGLESEYTSVESPLLEAFLTGFRYPQFAKPIKMERG